MKPARARTLRAWESVLDFADIAVSDVTFVNIEAGPPSMPYGDVARREISALNRAEVDVVILYGAKGLEMIRDQGLKELYRFTPEAIHETPALEGLIEQRALTVDPLLLEAHPEAVGRVIDRLMEVPEWANDFPREALNQASLEAGVSLDDADSAYGSLLAQSAELGLEPHRLQRLERLRLWLSDKGLITTSPQAVSPIEAWMEPPKQMHSLDEMARV
jgi:ABC-type nitrate/sulfonate/bicarbonate transport system substrate-binding protein